MKNKIHMAYIRKRTGVPSFEAFTFVLLILGFLCSSISSAQWITVNVGTPQDLYSVDYFSTNDIWIGSLSQFIRTGNNGLTWSVVNPLHENLGGTLIGNMYDIEVTSPSSAIGTGFFYLGNSEVILQTSNNGAIWNLATINNGGNWPRYINSVDRNGSVCIVVGSNGRVARSTDYGNSWAFISSGTFNMINDVKFISADTVIAAGENVILKSIDAGITWTSVAMPGIFHSLSARQNYVYIGAESSDSLFKSADGGQTFTSIPLPFSYHGVVYAISRDTVLVAGDNGLYKSDNGGQYWEHFALSGYHPVEMMDFLNSSQGIAVGDSGYVIRTNDLGSIPTLPIVRFSMPGGLSYCIGDSVSLLNQSAAVNGYTYSWAIDGAVFSTQYNASHRLNNPGTHTISLTITNAGGSASFSQQIIVTGHTSLPFVIQSVPASNCSGNIGMLTIPNSQTGVLYQLRTGFTNVGSSQAGNGSTLFFLSGTGITSPTAFNVIAKKSSSCFTDSNIVYYTVNPVSGGPRAACIPSGDNSFGISNVSFNTIHNASPTGMGHYTDYACQINTNAMVGTSYPISVSTSGTGWCAVWIDYDTSGSFSSDEQVFLQVYSSGGMTGSIAIPSTYRNFNTPLRMRVAYDRNNSSLQLGCGTGFPDGEYEDYSLTVSMAPMAPAAAFSFTTTTVCTTSVNFSNATFNSNNFIWDFGDGTTSTSFTPVHEYTNSGTYTVTLIAINSYGSDTAIQTVVVHNPTVPAASCNPTAYGLSCSRILATGVQLQKSGGYYYQVLTGISTFQVDLTCSKQAPLQLDSTYNLSFALREMGTTNCTGNSCMWIDWNNDGVLNDTNERLVAGNLGAGCPATFWSFTVPHTAVLDTPLRFRIVASANWISTSCTPACGQFVDFSVVVHSYPAITPAFTANVTSACVPAFVTFTNTSTNAVSYSWDFGDGTTSALTSPSHVYTQPGIYSVKLLACNSGGGCDSLLRTAYINVRPTIFSVHPMICPGQSFQIGTHSYSAAGTYIDSLSSFSGCDSIVTTLLTISPLPTVTVVASGPTSFCQGDSVVLTASAGLLSWQWYRSNHLLSGSTGQVYTAKYRGLYWCIGYNAAQCANTSNGIRVSVPCVPMTPPILRERPPGDDDEEGIRVFPNPGSGVFNIRSQEGRMEIYNFTGALVFSKQMEEGIHELDLSEWKDGIYLVIVKNEFAQFTSAIVLSKQ